MNKIRVVPVVLCGGSGTRLWPLSREGFPKQFLTISGNSSLFQSTFERVNQIKALDIDVQESLVVANESHRFLILDQLRELNNEKFSLLLEPVGKDTAPALTIAALKAIENGEDPVLVVTPADHMIVDSDKYVSIIEESIRLAEIGSIMVLGIKPKSAETGYGYIKCDQKLGLFGESNVLHFAEKPKKKVAVEYLESGDYFWNSGIFILKASVWLGALEKFRPDILDATTRSWINRVSDDKFIRPNKAIFSEIPSASIDCAVIESCVPAHVSVKMMPLDVGWTDLGAWDAVWAVGSANSDGNVVNGDVLLEGTLNSYVHSTSRLVSVIGLSDLVVVETPDAVLVADKKQSQSVKELIASLAANMRQERVSHRKVFRPWGWYDSVDCGDNFKVKRLQVNPGASLSLQMHNHRAEHWIVVSGVAEITNGNNVIQLSKNQSTYIPRCQIHRLSNPGSSPLEIIEVQSGDYLCEDDIVRFDDVYGRVSK